MPRMIAAWMIAVAAMAVLFAIAIAFAVNVAPKVAMADTHQQVQLVELSSALKLATAKQGTANSKCELLDGLEKNSCDGEAAKQAKPLKEIDTALYRAHRQLP